MIIGTSTVTLVELGRQSLLFMYHAIYDNNDDNYQRIKIDLPFWMLRVCVCSCACVEQCGDKFDKKCRKGQLVEVCVSMCVTRKVL